MNAPRTDNGVPMVVIYPDNKVTIRSSFGAVTLTRDDAWEAVLYLVANLPRN